MSGLMMLQLGMLPVLAPDWLSRLSVAFVLLGVALGVTWVAARLTRA
jgi:hypothetical protein